MCANGEMGGPRGLSWWKLSHRISLLALSAYHQGLIPGGRRTRAGSNWGDSQSFVKEQESRAQRAPVLTVRTWISHERYLNVSAAQTLFLSTKFVAIRWTHETTTLRSTRTEKHLGKTYNLHNLFETATEAPRKLSALFCADEDRERQLTSSVWSSHEMNVNGVTSL